MADAGSLLGALRGRVGALRAPALERTQATFDRLGFHLLPHHYYVPIPEQADLTESFWQAESELVGVDTNEQGALELVEILRPHIEELRAAVPLEETPGARFHLLNSAFMAVDAHVYYGLLRHFQPETVIEVGAGWSTLVALAANEANRVGGGKGARLVAVDPFPSPVLESLEDDVEIVPAKLQDVELERFTALRSGDVLFVDSTHVLRAGGDVQRAYCEIFPRLAPGVLVHVHDVSLPRPYPRSYFDNRWYWNEQYVLQTFLAFNSRFEVLWPGNVMAGRHPEAVAELFPELAVMRRVFPQSEPSSFWMRVRG
ncbi:MAG: class I SAM-dependent methyltransferase [Gaiellaceae bacterium]